MAYMKCSSHRARKRLLGVIGADSQGYYSFRDTNYHGVYWVSAELLERARKLKGVTRARNQDPDFWLHCW